MKRVVKDGNEICSSIAYLFTEISGIYPITPSSPMAENIDKMASSGEKNLFDDTVKVVEMQSEAGAAGMVHGALVAGTLATTFTASQGLLLMIPNMYKIAGEMLPAVFHVAARSLSTHALSIMGDHQDIYAVRSTGFAILASSNVQDIAFLTPVAHLTAIDSNIPMLHFFDGFRTSHEINKVDILEKEEIRDLLNKENLTKFRNKAINPRKPNIRGTNQNDDVYFQITEARNSDYNELVNTVEFYMNEINKKAGTNYKPFNYYGSKEAKKLIVAMGSVNDTIKEVIDNSDEKLGLIEVHLYRPFSKKHFLQELPDSVEKIAVLDRTKEFCSREPLYLDVVDVLKEKNIQVVGGRYGLSGKNTTPSHINAVYNMLDNPKDDFTIGIIDDVTNLSLKEMPFKIENTKDILIYGYGSDGMVSFSKSIVNMIGENTDKYVQCYNEYDSKKSGGMTVNHLRFSDEPINKPYYIDSAKLIVVAKEKYLHEIDLLENICNNGTLLINTNKTSKELENYINSDNLKIIKEKNIKIYTIDATGEALKLGLKEKINMFLSLPVIDLISLIDLEEAKQYFISFVENKYKDAGNKIIELNKIAIDKSMFLLKEVCLDNSVLKENKESNDFYEQIYNRNGNKLTVKDVLLYKDGIHNPYYKDNEPISSIIPKWLNENCIECNQCSFVCPNNVIKTFLLNEEEYLKCPDNIKKRCKNSRNKGYYFALAVDSRSCTGCGVCIKTCPGIKGNKALEKMSINEEEQTIFEYLNENIEDKHLMSDDTVIGCSFKNSGFRKPSSCAGCGEVTYLKILTQLFKDEIMIANATGCSSIYGGTLLNNPYSIPWASSLFEDNAEFGYGILMGNHVMKNRIASYMLKNLDKHKEIYTNWLQNPNNVEIAKKVEEQTTDEEIKELKDYLYKRNLWIVGGDGWAYDIGFSGIDHILSSNDNVNILVLDTGAYSNTGGQMSKATPLGAVASFASSGKKTGKKDLASIAIEYPNCYVATISLGANMVQTIKAFKEASNHNGPSIVIAYAPCIAHGIIGGLERSVEIEKLAVTSGFFPLIRYNPINQKLTLDSKNVDFSTYNDFMESQTRFTILKEKNPKQYNKLIELSKQEAIFRYQKYETLSNESKVV